MRRQHVDKVRGSTRRQPPLPPSARHFLGTDPYGRDVLSQLMYSTRAEFVLGMVAALVTVVIGTAVAELLDAMGRSDWLGIDAPPAWTHVHRWTYARPAQPREEPFGLADGIGVCGDGWRAPSKVESAWTSGHLLGTELGARLRSG